GFIFAQSHALSSPSPTGSSEHEARAQAQLRGLRKILFALGLSPAWQPAEAEAPQEIAMLARRRWAAKQAKDFKGADALRAELTAAGWSMLDGKDGYRLEPLKK